MKIFLFVFILAVATSSNGAEPSVDDLLASITARINDLNNEDGVDPLIPDPQVPIAPSPIKELCPMDILRERFLNAMRANGISDEEIMNRLNTLRLTLLSVYETEGFQGRKFGAIIGSFVQTNRLEGFIDSIRVQIMEQLAPFLRIFNLLPVQMLMNGIERNGGLAPTIAIIQRRVDIMGGLNGVMDTLRMYYQQSGIMGPIRAIIDSLRATNFTDAADYIERYINSITNLLAGILIGNSTSGTIDAISRVSAGIAGNQMTGINGITGSGITGSISSLIPSFGGITGGDTSVTTVNTGSSWIGSLLSSMMARVRSLLALPFNLVPTSIRNMIPIIG